MSPCSPTIRSDPPAICNELLLSDLKLIYIQQDPDNEHQKTTERSPNPGGSPGVMAHSPSRRGQKQGKIIPAPRTSKHPGEPKQPQNHLPKYLPAKQCYRQFWTFVIARVGPFAALCEKSWCCNKMAVAGRRTAVPAGAGLNYSARRNT